VSARRPRFRDKPPEEYPRPDTNPFLSLHREFGPPVLTAGEAAEHYGRWPEAFGGREAPLHLEVGSGNGFFLAGMAAAHPGCNWLGVEIRFKRVVLVAKKLQAAGVEGHARIARYDARYLDDLFQPGELAGLYLNHPDPWPRERQVKHRLIQGPWLDMMLPLIAPGGEIRVKSDAPWNVQAMVDLVEGRPLEILGRSDDIARHGAPWPGDVTTNYQSKFDKRGLPVYAVRVRKLA
jgi:tRNA (guanine-N7-)-methyltransferase